MTMNSITPKELKDWIDSSKEHQIIDIREDWEREVGYINGSVHIVMNLLTSQLDSIRTDCDVVIHCRSGSRSAAVTRHLETQLGFNNIHNLDGGITAWAEQVAQDRGELKVIGVNHAIHDKDITNMKGQTVNPKLAQEQCTKLAKIKSNRDNDAVNHALDNLSQTALGQANTMEAILIAVKAECTIGEIMNSLKDSFGTWMAPSGF